MIVDLTGARISGSSVGYSKKPTTTNTEEFPGRILQKFLKKNFQEG